MTLYHSFIVLLIIIIFMFIIISLYDLNDYVDVYDDDNNNYNYDSLSSYSIIMMRLLSSIKIKNIQPRPPMNYSSRMKAETHRRRRRRRRRRTRRNLLSSSLSSSHRSLSLSSSKDSFIKVSLGPLQNENIHTASIIQHHHHNNNNNNNNNNKIENNNNDNDKEGNSIGTSGTTTTTTTGGSSSNVRYVKDVLCNGCRYSYSSQYKNTTCFYEMQQLRIQNPNLSIIEAATIVSSYNANYCQRCHPNTGCHENDKIYYCPDDIMSGPFIEYATTHFLQSIHKEDRIPHNVLMSEDIFKEFVSNPNNTLPNREYYFEFNPSIVQLPKNQIPIQQLIDSGYPNINIDMDRFYIASYRVSTGHHCFQQPEEVQIRYLNGKRVQVKDYLGIAILDVNLNILIETIVDLKGSLFPIIPGEGGNTYQDGRLFNFNNQLYLGSVTKLFPIWLINPPSYDSNNDYYLKVVLLSHYMKSEQKLNKWTDETNEQYNNQFNVYINQRGYCSNDYNKQRKGKNLNYFYDDKTNTNNHIVMELYPMGPKEFLHDKYCINSNETIDFIIPNIPIPQPSYSTTDELEISYYNQTTLPYENDRGSTCCIEIIDPRSDNNNTLLVGISHKRTLPQNIPSNIYPLMYFNNFYAMESIAPYNIVAISGRFCLEYPNNINEMNFTYPRMKYLNLQIGNEQYNNCPSIQFITGIIETIHDTNKVIISYGIDDCLSRFIIIDKKHIITLLFNPSNMIT